MSAILVLKPIIDALYDDMKDYKQKTDKRIKELESELASLRNQRKPESVSKNVVVIEESDDDEFAEEAKANPAAPVQVATQSENNKNVTIINEDVKTIKTVSGKDRKEYMKEYQRNYRKKQKNIALNL
jgi:FKBP-type peptidyl-prolyl cis-trans isomerase